MKKANVTLQKDGAAWHATFSDFQDLAVSLSGFGDTPLDAVMDLAGHTKNALDLTSNGEPLRDEEGRSLV